METANRAHTESSSGQEETRHVPATRTALLILVALATVWLALGWDLTRRNSPTADELAHAAAGWAIRSVHDYRVNPEHPPLWKAVSALPHRADTLEGDFSSPLWQVMLPRYDFEWIWSAHLLYEDEPLEGVSYIKRARLPMLLFGLVLGGTIVAWAWRLGGPAAAILAGLLFVVEPNLLVHSALITSDVPLAAMFLLTLFVLSSRAQGRWRHLRSLATGVLLGLALASKFSALILPLLVTVLIIARPFLEPGERAAPRSRRTLLSGITAEFLIVAITSWITLWGAYGFRFAPSPTGELMSIDRSLEFFQNKSKLGGVDQDSFVVDAAVFAERHRLFPQSYSIGLIWAHASTFYKQSYLLGELSPSGRWYYFPVALALKLPTVLILAILAGLALFRRGVSRASINGWQWWSLVLPSAAFFATALTSEMNIGIRHVFPVLPPLIIIPAVFIVCSVRRRAAFASVVLLAAVLGAGELLASHPHELSYFNLFAGGQERAIHLLGDSNLDWGQDLERLAEWRRRHPCTHIHLAYFGTAPPEAFGIEYEELSIKDPTKLPELESDRDEVLIVSSNHLQGIAVSRQLQPFYSMLRSTEPDEIIGTTLYVYRIGPQAPCDER